MMHKVGKKMGFFTRKRKSDKVSSLDSSPRCHHYTMAHYALRNIALDDPLFYLAVLASDDSNAFLESIFRAVCEHCHDRGEKPDFKAADLRVHRTHIGVYPCAIIEMPEPVAMTEAFFTALVLLVDPSTSQVSDDAEVPAQYFTLEKSFDLDGTPKTVLGRWNNQGTHSSCGDGPEPTLRDFIAYLAGAYGETTQP
ncbi:MAG: hypothetical protein JW818_12950 [Pirellulales bacterium]|nr:hypothetical protein [Pirellulales bacterium]